MSEMHGLEMMDEFRAWHRVVEELKNASAAIDLNAEPRLHAAICVWGEFLVQLRMQQDEAARTSALDYALAL